MRFLCDVMLLMFNGTDESSIGTNYIATESVVRDLVIEGFCGTR
jgi:hypothetical protein